MIFYFILQKDWARIFCSFSMVIWGRQCVVEKEPFTVEIMLACINGCGVHHLSITGQDFFRFTELLSKFTQELPFSLERDSFRYFHLASFCISEGQFQVL